MYYSFPQTQLAPQAVQPPAPVPVASTPLKYPRIPEWIEYCDRNPDRCGANLSAIIPKIQEQGFCFINQLTGSRITVEKLSGWLAIAPGTADLIMGFAEEDCKLIAAGTFTMVLPDGIAALAGGM
jgi:hypothetical protein